MEPKISKQTSKRTNFIKLTAVYAIMVAAIVLIVALIFMFTLGYRFSSGRIEQYAFLQFNSSPAGAIVTVDGQAVSSQTPNKASVPAGSHNVVIKRENYQDWKKTVTIKSATMNWLNYAILVPSKLEVEAVSKLESIYASLTSPDKMNMLIQEKSDKPTFILANLSSDDFKSTKLEIPTKAYSEATTVDVVHSFTPVKWDEGGRYMLIKHTYGNSSEWLVMDTQDASLTKNITQIFNIAVDDINFSGTSGNEFYILSSGDVRKLNLSAGTISRPFINNVSNFNIYNANIITYVGVNDNKSKQVVGIYRDGDESAHILRQIDDKSVSLKIATTRYFNEDYVVIAENRKIDILRGSYPNSVKDTTSLKVTSSIELKQDVGNLSFSPTGEYVFAQSKENFASYDLEYQNLSEGAIVGSGELSNLKWLDNDYIWSDRNGDLTIREFDGANAHTINHIMIGQDVAMTHNKRYIYSINKISTGYQLQRVRMILK